MNSLSLNLVLTAADAEARRLGVTTVTMAHVLHAWLSMDREGQLAKEMRDRGVTAEVVARICRFGDQALRRQLEGLTYAEKVAMHRQLTELLAAQDVAGTGS